MTNISRFDKQVMTAARGGYELIKIPAGSFIMRQDGKKTLHDKVELSDFYIGRYPVTNKEYSLFLNQNPKTSKPIGWDDPLYNKPLQPVVGVKWEDAVSYCDWAGLTLPTEAQWEYACRAGKTTKYWFGDEDDDLKQFGWYEANSDDALHEVGMLPSNPFGLFDMNGNSWEWCRENAVAYSIPPCGHDAERMGGDTTYRMLRGGAFNLPAYAASSAYRFLYPADSTDVPIGFRGAITIADLDDSPQRAILFNNNPDSPRRENYSSKQEYIIEALGSLKQVLADITRFGSIQPGKTVGLATRSNIKRASLFFDQTVILSLNEIEHDKTKNYPSIEYSDKPSKNSDTYCYEYAIIKYDICIPKGSDANQQYKGNLQNIYYASLNHFKEKHLVEPTTLISKKYFHEQDIPLGESLGFIATINKLPVIIEGKTPWEQIIEFRKDTKVVNQLRDMRNWLQDCVKAKTLSEAEDIIQAKMENYKAALIKHGANTKKGIYAGLITFVKLLENVHCWDLWQMLTNVGFMVGGITLFVKDRKMKLDAIRKQNHEITLIYDAIEKFGSNEK